MKRTAEELIALRAKREGADKELLREERRRAAGRAKRRKMRDGDLLSELALTTAELHGLVLDAQRPGTRERWARLGRGVNERPDDEVTSTATAVAAE